MEAHSSVATIIPQATTLDKDLIKGLGIRAFESFFFKNMEFFSEKLSKAFRKTYSFESKRT